MTGIAERKSQWEQEARDDERRMIVVWLDAMSARAADESDGGDFDAGFIGGIELIADKISVGEYRKAKSE